MSLNSRVRPWSAIACALFVALIASRARAQVPGELHGRITDARTARPIADARIELSGRADIVRSSADGSFVLRGLEPRDYLVRVRAFGFVALDRDVTVANGRATSMDVALEPLPTALGAVVVRGQRDSLPTNAITFDRAAIEASGRRDLGELLQTSAGVVITQAGGPGSASRASIRGSSAGEVLVLVDGVPINSQITGEADLSRVSLEAVERVVVRSGAQSARYGGRALAGVVEITTRRASRESSALLRDGAWGERQMAATLGDGRSADSRRMSGSVTGEYRTVRGDFPYDVPALRGGGTTHRTNSDVTSRQVLGGLTVEGDSMTLRARGSWADLSRGLAGSIVQPSSTGRQGDSRASAGVDARLERRGIAWASTGDITREHSTFADSAPPFGTAYDDAVTATGMTGTVSATAGRGPVLASLGGEARALSVASTMLAPTAPHWQRLLGAWGTARFSRLLEGAQARFDADVSARVDESSLIGDVVVSPRGAVALSAGLTRGVGIDRQRVFPALARRSVLSRRSARSREPWVAAGADDRRCRGTRSRTRHRRWTGGSRGRCRGVPGRRRRDDSLAAGLSLHLESVQRRRAPFGMGVERARRASPPAARGSRNAQSRRRRLRGTCARRSGCLPTAYDGQCDD